MGEQRSVLRKLYEDNLAKLSIITLICLIFVIAIVTTAKAEPTQQYNKIYLNPYVVNAMVANTNYTYYVNVNPPDSISSVINAMINLNVYFSSSATNFTIMVKNTNNVEKGCNTKFFYVSAVYGTAGPGPVSFDCSNVINHAGNYSIQIRTDRAIGASYAWLDLTYMNDPRGSLTMGGTEYKIDNFGKVWVQLVNASGQSVDNATCKLNIYYPDGTLFISGASMDHLLQGIYQYDFVTPRITGVYPTAAICYYGTTSQTETADSSNTWIGSTVSGGFTDTYTDNGVYWSTNEVDYPPGGPILYRIDLVENFTSVTQPAAMTDMTIRWNGRWTSSTDYITLQIWNYTSNSWFSLSNTIGNTGGVDATVTNTITTSNLTTSGLLSGGQIRIRMVDTTNADSVASQLQVDQLVLLLNALSGDRLTTVMGSSEVHISPPDTKPVVVETLCGDETSACAYFTNDGEYNLPEGELEDNITVYSLTKELSVDTTWTYTTPLGVNCDALYHLYFYNTTSSSWVDVVSDVTTMAGVEDNCVMTVPITLNPVSYQDSYLYHIKMDNYMAWEINWTKDLISIVNQTVYENCYNYIKPVGYNYTVPITDSVSVSVNPLVLYCHRSLDDLYWFYYYYGLSQTRTTSGEVGTFLQEARFYKTAFFQDLTVATYFLQNYTYGNTVGIIDMISPSQIKFVGSTEYVAGEIGKLMAQFLRNTGSTQVPENAANCTARIIAPNGSVSYSQLAYVSQSNGIYSSTFTVPSNTGVYLASFMCNQSTRVGYGSATFHVYTQSSSTSINYTQLGEYVWNSTVRTITSYPAINYSQIAEFVWNYTNKTVNLNATIDYILSINTSIQSKLNMLQTTINGLNNLSAADVWSYSNKTVNLTEVLTYLNGINITITSYYNELKGVITSINNLSAYDVWSYSGGRNLTYYPNIDYGYIQQLMWNATNRSLTDMLLSASDIWNYQNRNLTFMDFTSVLNRIDLANSTIITEIQSVNQSIFNKLYLIQGDLLQINDTLNTVNTTAWDVDYWVKQNNDLLLNLSLGNVSVYASLNWSKLEEVVFNYTSSSKIRSDILSYAGGMGDTFSATDQYCENETTLMIKNNVTRCALGQCYSNVDYKPIFCQNGCSMNECRQPNYIIYAIMVIIIIIAFIIVLYFNREADT